MLLEICFIIKIIKKRDYNLFVLKYKDEIIPVETLILLFVKFYQTVNLIKQVFSSSNFVSCIFYVLELFKNIFSNTKLSLL